MFFLLEKFAHLLRYILLTIKNADQNMSRIEKIQTSNRQQPVLHKNKRPLVMIGRRAAVVKQELFCSDMPR